MKKMWLFSPLILSILSSPLFGEQNGEIAKGTVFSQSQKKQACVTDKNCSSCCSPQMDYRLPSDFHGATTFAECLVWQVQQQASHFVITPNENSTIDSFYPNTEGLGEIQSASFDWNAGVRVGLGYTALRDAWQVLGQYTWFSTSGDATYEAPSLAGSQVLMPTFYVQSTTGTTAAKNDVDFSYQMGDLLVTRSFLPTEQIKLNFSFGGTGGYIKENFNAVYSATNNTYVQNNWSFGGGGFRAGLNSNWHIGYGFGVFGKVSFAAILGHYANFNRITADGPIVSSGNPIYLADTNYKGILLMPTTQIALGFDWCKTFTKCRISGVNVALAAELNNLANLQQVFKVPTATSLPTEDQAPMLRDLSSVYMYGANFRVGLDY
jgi:hypothetical protein